MINNDTIEKWKEFKGPVAKKFLAPTTYRRYSGGAAKILKLWYRMQKADLFWPELLTKIQEVTNAWISIGLNKYKRKIPDAIFEEFDRILSFNLNNYLKLNEALGNLKVYTEETRERKETQCNFCKAHLVYPAYIVYRETDKELKRSQPIGIVCLHTRQHALNRLMDAKELQSILAEATGMVNTLTKV